jgi:hypothetical protein
MAPTSIRCSTTELAELGLQLFERGAHLRFTARGSSMHPFILDGDALIVRPIAQRRPRIGQVLLCRNGEGRVLAHRLVRVHRAGAETRLVTKGDNVSDCDVAIGPRHVLGHVIAIERSGRIIRMETFFARALGLLWAGVSPWSRWLRPGLRWQRWLLRLVPGF